jgi:hypothetical protein
MANPHPFATVNHIRLALRIPHVSHLHGDLVFEVSVEEIAIATEEVRFRLPVTANKSN